MSQAEEAVRVATDEFQRQYEITRVLLERAQRATVLLHASVVFDWHVQSCTSFPAQ